MYAVRRIKDGFRMHKTESDKGTIEQLIKQAENNYQIVQRQVTYFVSEIVWWWRCIVIISTIHFISSNVVLTAGHFIIM